MRKIFIALISVLIISGCDGMKEKEQTVKFYLYYADDSIDKIDSSRAGGGLTFFTYRAKTETEYEIDLRLFNSDGGIVRRTIDNDTVYDKLVIYFIENNIQPYIEVDYEYTENYLERYINEISLNGYSVNEIRMYVYEEDYVRNEISLDN
jgi:hypothetical protein